MGIRRLLKRVVASLGYTITPTTDRLPVDARFGLDVFGYLVDALVRARSPEALFLLQVGANDGVDEDVVNPVLTRHRIPSVLCEPLPDAFQRLVQTYQHHEHVKCLQCAVGPHDGELTLFRLAPQLAQHESSKIASFDRAHVEHYRALWRLPVEAVITEQVPCLTVQSLLEPLARDHVDLAVIDTEGMDHLICRDLLQLTPAPEVIHFEYANSPIDEIRALFAELTARGYTFVRGGLDVTAARAL